MSEEDLVKAICDDPENEDAWAAYGEYLHEQGDIRGKIISMELMGGSDRVKEIFHFNMGKWCGEELVELLAELALEEKEKCLSIKWKNGFIKSFRIDSHYSQTAVESADILKTVISSPAAIFTTKLAVGILDFESADNKVVGIIKNYNLTALRELHLGDTDELDISWMSVGDVSDIFTAAPNLSSLRIKGTDVGLGSIKHAYLKELILESGGLPFESVISIMEADLPSLEKLEIWFGSKYYGATCTIAMLEPLFTETLFPRLVDLGLMNSEFQNEIVEALSKSSLVKQLKTLDLSMGVMVDRSAKLFIKNYDHFSHLESINLSENFISKRVCKKLENLYGSRIDVSSQGYSEYDVYVSVGE